MPPGRNRVLSFMSQWRDGGQRSPTTDDAPNRLQKSTPPPSDRENEAPKRPLDPDTISPQALMQRLNNQNSPAPHSPSALSRARGDSRAGTRPNSMIQTYQPPQMELATDTPPELAPIFTFLNSHSNKLYMEGYFLKLHDLDSRGRPSSDRVWNECFAQLVGTVLSLWDAAALDAAGEDGEVVPTFVNLSDASIKMIEHLPMNGAQGGSLQNVLSVSTAANNRYLLHFNSLNSLTQWTAGIRLAMFEHSTLHEAYTGSLIAGKGRYLNNIRQIMERSRFPYDDWARVRFGAGTPWKRCWCVISPPDEKEYQKFQKTSKKGGAYSRANLPKGDIKFYDTRKITKKTKPIATINDAYAAYAIYPQSKPLIDQSTLVKLEGLVTIHGQQETTTEGFVFVMPEVHAAVSGFEMLLRWIFRVYDTFCLYGRPTRLIADTLDQRGLMFAMPKDRRYGYLDILDVSGLIHTNGSQNWSERQWRKEMRKLTATRMTTQMEDRSSLHRPVGPRRNTASRSSLPPSRTGGVQFQEPAIHSTPGSRSSSPAKTAADGIRPPKRVDSAPPSSFHGSPHKRSVSDAHGYRTQAPSRLSHEQSREYDEAPEPPRHGDALGADMGDRERTGSPYEQAFAQANSPYIPPPEPVVSPPALQHNPHSRPLAQPHVAPELLRKHSNVDAATLYQMQDAQRPAGEEDYPVVRDYDQDRVTLAYRDQYAFPANQPQGFVGTAADYSSHQRDQRLSTIPGSPCAGDDNEYFDAEGQPSIDGVASDGPNQRPELAQLQSSQGVTRKPLPRQLPQVPPPADAPGNGQQVREMDPRPSSPASDEAGDTFVDSVDGYVDEDALALFLKDGSERTNSIASSKTPDYASTPSLTSLEKEAIKKPKEFVRTGRLKTVGDPNVTAQRLFGRGKLDTWDKDNEAEAAGVPTVDFGPTYVYKPTSRPGTSGTITPGPGDFGRRRSRSRSADRLRQSPGSRLSGYIETPAVPGESKGNRNSSFGPRTPTPTGIGGTENADPMGPRRPIMAWAPGAVVSPGNTLPNRQGLTPEQWVQYRAELATHQPQYALPRRTLVPTHTHQRTASTSQIPQQRQAMTRTPPPFGRAVSGDWSAPQKTPPSRPHSRGASAYLNQAGGLQGSDAAANLSAKEQMHVSRATGTPLISMASSSKGKTEEHSPGLVGALEARQREKAAMSQGVRSSLVQQAIIARQQETIRVEQEAQMQMQMQRAAQQQAQAAQFQQQMAYQRAMMEQQQYVYQQQPVPPPIQHRQSWGPGRQHQLSQQMGGFGGQYVQQQGVIPQQRMQQQAYGHQQMHQPQQRLRR